MSDPQAPVLDGRYQLTRRIAGGGMGTVWEATDERLGRSVAVKLLNEGLTEDPRFIERFRREAQAAAGLSHPNVAGVFDYGEEVQRPYIVMELVPGETVAQRLAREGPLPPEEVARIGSGVASALTEAHAAGIVHRDIKPANVMLTPRGDVKVMDFGIASTALGRTGLTGTGMVLGTARYLSPEQAQGESATPASDIYSLGIVLYELASGAPPFDKESAVATAMAHASEAPTPLREIRPDFPADLAAVIERCMAKEPGIRPNAPELEVSLRSLADTAPVAAAANGTATEPLVAPESTAVLAAGAPAVAQGTTVGDTTMAGVPPGATPPSQRSRRRRWILAALLLAAVALVILFALLLGGGSAHKIKLASFRGKTPGQARALAARIGVDPAFTVAGRGGPSGVVIRQLPHVGSRVLPGSRVVLIVAPPTPSVSPSPSSPASTTPPPKHGHNKGHDKGHKKHGKGDHGD